MSSKGRAITTRSRGIAARPSFAERGVPYQVSTRRFIAGSETAGGRAACSRARYPARAGPVGGACSGVLLPGTRAERLATWSEGGRCRRPAMTGSALVRPTCSAGAPKRGIRSRRWSRRRPASAGRSCIPRMLASIPGRRASRRISLHKRLLLPLAWPPPPVYRRGGAWPWPRAPAGRTRRGARRASEGRCAGAFPRSRNASRGGRPAQSRALAARTRVGAGDAMCGFESRGRLARMRRAAS